MSPDSFDGKHKRHDPRVIYAATSTRDILARGVRVPGTGCKEESGRQAGEQREGVIYLPLACTHPDNSVEFGHGHLFGSVNSSGDLLLMFLREKRQDLGNYSV